VPYAIPIAPWHIIEATDRHYQHLTVANILIETITRHCETLENAPQEKSSKPATKDGAQHRNILDSLDLSGHIGRDDYKRELTDHGIVL